MNSESLIIITIILPTLSGLTCFFLGKKLRNIIVFLNTIILASLSIILLYRRDFTYSPAPIFETSLLVLDFILLAYFLYIGIKNHNILVIVLTILQALPITYFELTSGGHHAEPIMLVDRLSVFLCLIINIIGPIICIYAISYMDEHESHLGLTKSRQSRFFFFMLLLLGAMNGLIYSNSIYWLYFFWEVTTLSCYELIKHDRTEKAEKNALRALWMNLIGGVALIASMFISQHTIGSIALNELINAKAAPILLLSFSFMALAAFTKSAQFPFHRWLLGAMVAPTPVSALLHSSTMVNAGIYLLLRIAPAIKSTPLTWGIALVGAFTFMFSAVLAISQRVSKSILAYSTISNLGLIIVCAGVNSSLSYAAALTLLLFHSISKGMLFLGAGIIENKLHTRYIESWEGLLGKLPLTSVIMMAGIASMFLPPFGMLLGKWVAIDAASSSPAIGALPLIILIVIGSAATTLFWAKWLGHFTILPIREKKFKFESLPLPYHFSLIFLLSLDVLLSVGVAFVVNNLVIPVMVPNYIEIVTTPLFNINTGIGSFLVWQLWLAMGLIMAIGLYIMRRKGGIVTPPYLGGENVEGEPLLFRTTADTVEEFQVSGMFFDSDIGESRLGKYAIIVGILLILVMFVLVVI